MPADDDQVGTQLTRAAPRHAAAHAKGLGFVRGGEHDAAADSEGFAAQGGVEQLLDRRIEGVEVRVQDGGCRVHPGCPPIWRMVM